MRKEYIPGTWYETYKEFGESRFCNVYKNASRKLYDIISRNEEEWQESKIKYKEISKELIDFLLITFTNPSNLNINNIINKLYEDKYIDNVSLINIYTKDELKSYTIQLTIQPMNVQLSQNEILKCIENAISILELNNLCVKKEQ